MFTTQPNDWRSFLAATCSSQWGWHLQVDFPYWNFDEHICVSFFFISVLICVHAIAYFFCIFINNIHSWADAYMHSTCRKVCDMYTMKVQLCSDVHLHDHTFQYQKSGTINEGKKHNSNNNNNSSSDTTLCVRCVLNYACLGHSENTCAHCVYLFVASRMLVIWTSVGRFFFCLFILRTQYNSLFTAQSSFLPRIELNCLCNVNKMPSDTEDVIQFKWNRMRDWEKERKRRKKTRNKLDRKYASKIITMTTAMKLTTAKATTTATMLMMMIVRLHIVVNNSDCHKYSLFTQSRNGFESLLSKWNERKKIWQSLKNH